VSTVDKWNVSVDRWWSVTDRKTEVLGENLVPLPLYPSRQRKKNENVFQVRTWIWSARQSISI